MGIKEVQKAKAPAFTPPAVFEKTDHKEIGNESLPAHAKSFISLWNIVDPKFQVNSPFSNMLNMQLKKLGSITFSFCH